MPSPRLSVVTPAYKLAGVWLRCVESARVAGLISVQRAVAKARPESWRPPHVGLLVTALPRPTLGIRGCPGAAEQESQMP